MIGTGTMRPNGTNRRMPQHGREALGKNRILSKPIPPAAAPAHGILTLGAHNPGTKVAITDSESLANRFDKS